MKAAIYLLSMAIAPGIFAADSWVPYTAHYVETDTVHDANGLVNQTRSEYVEYRTADGSTARFRQVAGAIVSGSVWLGCGDMIDLDYGHKLACLKRSNPPRQHTRIHKDWPTLGTATIAGLSVTGWPINGNGGGAIWIDVPDDILAKLQDHTPQPTGITIDSLKELTSIDLSTPVDDSTTELPAGFKLDGSVQHTCSSTFGK